METVSSPRDYQIPLSTNTTLSSIPTSPPVRSFWLMYQSPTPETHYTLVGLETPPVPRPLTKVRVPQDSSSDLGFEGSFRLNVGK